ncbi:hypothetical protein LAZ67_4002080 [Cordylochernes scorpioides]|uniref:Transposable element Tc1 transposase n=1 Tax=Cordylochernes scorpioides TaxID=51811 RepID=A0ABY6KCP8_9ARAC|nr:hypothetical protein LAZ67_4002080 [Cordylochernes scorpioides]
MYKTPSPNTIFPTSLLNFVWALLVASILLVTVVSASSVKILGGYFDFFNFFWFFFSEIMHQDNVDITPILYPLYQVEKSWNVNCCVGWRTSLTRRVLKKFLSARILGGTWFFATSLVLVTAYDCLLVSHMVLVRRIHAVEQLEDLASPRGPVPVLPQGTSIEDLFKSDVSTCGSAYPSTSSGGPQATCTAILQHVQDTLDHSISIRTISRRLVANGSHSCRPLRRLPLTPPNRRQRLEWCRARSTWMTEWHRVVFSDESRFCLSSDSRRVRVWRRRGERSNPAAIVERPTVRQRGIMVWGAIAYDSRSPLLRIQGTMTAQRYVDDVLRPVTLPYLQGVPNALYQQDNARPHTARISQQALQDVQMLPLPPYSPDLSPIEHVWDIIGRRLHALPQPRSEDELWQMVEREWRAIPQDAIRTLIDFYLDVLLRASPSAVVLLATKPTPFSLCIMTIILK